MRTPGRTTLAAAAAVLSATSALALAVPATAAPYPGPGGTRDVHGDIEGTYLHLGGPAGLLGGPLTDETRTPNGRGAYNAFERGSIYWTPGTGAHEVHGAIREAWASRSWENSFLGFPLTNEVTTPNGRGAYNAFEGGSIYWTPATGAHEVHGAIRDAWAAQSYENGRLGFPASDEYVEVDDVLQEGGARADFQGGCILWNPQHGATVLSPPSACPPQGD